MTDFLIMEWHFTANSLTDQGVFRKKGESSGEGENRDVLFVNPERNQFSVIVFDMFLL